jgi:hypothetical protein
VDERVDFDAFVELYPRQEGVWGAAAAWADACRSASPHEVMEGLQRYVLDPNRVDKYTPKADKWLRERQWMNGPLPARNGNQHEAPAEPRSFSGIRAALEAGGGSL